MTYGDWVLAFKSFTTRPGVDAVQPGPVLGARRHRQRAGAFARFGADTVNYYNTARLRRDGMTTAWPWRSCRN
jgi:hypothetical protein